MTHDRRIVQNEEPNAMNQPSSAGESARRKLLAEMPVTERRLLLAGRVDRGIGGRHGSARRSTAWSRRDTLPIGCG